MSDYTASKSLPTGRTVWVMTFRHPLRKDAKGKAGLKVRRSLGTTNEAEADTILSQMTELLADQNLHSLLKRGEAERRFHPIVVSAFYDALDASTLDPVQLRETKVPFPGNGIPKVLLVGATGSGKTSLLRHIIGSDPKNDRFPSTSTSRTTTCDTEVILDPNDKLYKAVVTFRTQWEVTASVSECLSNGCLAALRKETDDKVAERLLHHPDQIFRLNYVLGSYSMPASSNDEDWTYEGEPEDELIEHDSSESAMSAEDRKALQTVLNGWIQRIRHVTELSREKTEAELGISFATLDKADTDFAEEYFEAVAEELPEFDDLIDDILTEVLMRFKHLPEGELSCKTGGWPECWTCTIQSQNRNDFIQRVRWFSSNYADAFGTLVTPLVQGIRVRGPFQPRFTSEPFEAVLIDGQGFGHTPESSASVSTQITKRYQDVDTILLVDNATQSMLAASLSISRSVLAAGYQRKFAIAFTHADGVVGPNLPDFASKRSHIMRSALAAFSNLRESLGAPLVENFERGLDLRSFMLGWLDKPITIKSKGPVREMERLLALCRNSAVPEIPSKAEPEYDGAELLLAAQSADAQFQDLWKARLGFIVLSGVQRKAWQTIKAFNKRVALSMNNGEYGDLRPVAELVARLSESIGKFLDKPANWKGPSDPAQRHAAIDNIRQLVFSSLHKFVEDRLLAEPLPDWVKAFEFSGRHSTFVRAQVIKDIIEGAAPIPNEAMRREVATFLSDLRTLVFDSIKAAGGVLANAA